MKRNSVEKTINASLNSLKPSNNIVLKAREYMKNDKISTKYRKNSIIKWSVAIASSLCVIITLAVILPIMFTNKYYGDDPRFISNGRTREVEFTSISDYSDEILSFSFEKSECKKIILNETNELLYIIESFSPDEGTKASKIEEIVVMKEYTGKVIQSIEKYMYMNDECIIDNMICHYKEISNGVFSYSFSKNDYQYYIVIYETDYATSVKIVETLIIADRSE